MVVQMKSIWSALLLAIFAQTVDENLNHFGAREFVRQRLARAEAAAHFGAAEDQVLRLVVRARPRGDDRFALLAIEGMLEHQRCDAQLVGPEVIEDQLRVVRAVIAAHPGVIAPDHSAGSSSAGLAPW